MRTIRTISRIAFKLGLAATLLAEPVAVKQIAGTTRGFLTVRTEEGKVVAQGELNQVAHCERINADPLPVSGRLHQRLYGQLHATLMIPPGEGTPYPKGPCFPKPSDYLVDVPASTTTSRSTDKDGKKKVEAEHMDFPPDLYNGVVRTILLNSMPNAPEFKISMVAPSGKGRSVKLAVTPAGQGSVSITGVTHQVNIFRIKVELGGIPGADAPIVGKQPADTYVWILPGPAPGLVRQVGQMYNEGPIVSIELSGTSFALAGASRP